jgi:hypothetical protein
LKTLNALKRLPEKSLPSSLFQREESFLEIRWKNPVPSLLRIGDEKKFYGFSKE